jgi:hypothetical protein
MMKTLIQPPDKQIIMQQYNYSWEPSDDDEELPDVIQPDPRPAPICGLCFAERL